MGRRWQHLQLDTEASAEKAKIVLLECMHLLSDGFHVTLVEDLEDIANAIAARRIDLECARDKEEKAWAKRDKAEAKVEAWEAMLYVEDRPPGERPVLTTKRLTELLDENRKLREQLALMTEPGNG